MSDDINTYTGRSFNLTAPRSLGTRAPAPQVRELMMSNGADVGVIVTCPCGWDIIVNPKEHKITVESGKITIEPAVTHVVKNGCGWAANIRNGEVIPVQVSTEGQDDVDEHEGTGAEGTDGAGDGGTAE